MSNRLSLLVGAAQAVLALIILMGWVDLSDEQLAGVIAVINAGVVAVAAWFEPAIPVGKTAPK